MSDSEHAWLTMRHPDVGDADTPPAVVTVEAFEETWEPKGWVKIADTDPAGAPLLEGTAPAKRPKAGAAGAPKEG